PCCLLVPPLLLTCAPSRRSSDLAGIDRGQGLAVGGEGECVLVFARDLPFLGHLLGGDAHAVGDGDVVVAEHVGGERDLVTHHRQDRKSTRLNSSHVKNQ